MSSVFGWLDHSDSERRRALDVVGLFREQGTVDELGIGLATYGAAAFDSDGTDPREAMFAAAHGDKPEGVSDIIPFWVFQVPDGARIERHVPALPLSRDRQRLEALRRSLTVYRMVFGQPRQDDLVSYLLARLPQEAVNRTIAESRIDLSPANRKAPAA